MSKTQHEDDLVLGEFNLFYVGTKPHAQRVMSTKCGGSWGLGRRGDSSGDRQTAGKLGRERVVPSEEMLAVVSESIGIERRQERNEAAEADDNKYTIKATITVSDSRVRSAWIGRHRFLQAS